MVLVFIFHPMPLKVTDLQKQMQMENEICL